MTMIAPARFRATLCGGAARWVLAQIGVGRVAAVFQRSLYIAAPGGALACIGPRGLGPGPLNLLCDGAPGAACLSRGLYPDMPVRRAGDALQIGDRLAIELAEAVEWHPPPVAPHSPAALAPGLAMLSVAAASVLGARGGASGWGDGFAPLVAPCAAKDLREAEAIAARDALLRLAWPGIAALAQWLCERPRSSAPAEPAPAAEILLGLGPGLTPSGDDFLGGALIALAALGRSEAASRLGAWVMARAARTNAVSAAHLACAAAGEGAGALHELLEALARPSADGIAAAVAALASLGHSSGWDMMAGAALSCAIVPG
ncbi:MAG: DUF2877 domain-containing protein [Alphaproteobacteria bacterium]|nr:DUF2877 domain-containing protein [Alphaproteobacteria bacterium]